MTEDLIIAGKRIRFVSGDGVNFSFCDRFDAFRASVEESPDLRIDIFPGRGELPDSAAMVFDAPLVEQVPGEGDNNQRFWEVYNDKETIYIRIFPVGSSYVPLLVIRKKELRWKYYADNGDSLSELLPYPSDGLVLFFLAVAFGGLMIHASGVSCNGRGWIFSGKSGSGKTTMALIFDRNGDRVIHDDRLILLPDKGVWTMHSTPVYRDDEPRSTAVDHLWFISHGISNMSAPVTGAEAVSLVISNSVQQNWDPEITSAILAAADSIAASVNVSRLAFIPDMSVIDFLSEREERDKATATRVAETMLEEERNVVITAGGYSMWPVLRPGERVIIEPCPEYDRIKRGSVIALRRDGGFVVHRVTEVKREGEGWLFRTRGDSSPVADDWSREYEVAGVIRNLLYRSKIRRVKGRMLPYMAGYLLSSVMAVICRRR